MQFIDKATLLTLRHAKTPCAIFTKIGLCDYDVDTYLHLLVRHYKHLQTY